MADALFAANPGARLRKQVLLVSDDAGSATPVAAYLEQEGYDILSVKTAAHMRSVTERLQFDFVILDFVLPDADGWIALRWLRARSAAPVVMLADRHHGLGKVGGLKIGPYDYLAKPIDRHALLALLRTSEHRGRLFGSVVGPAADDLIVFADWTFDVSKRKLTSLAGDVVHITAAEGRILVLFSENPGRVVTRDQLMDVTAGREWGPFDRSVDVHISNLRRKLDSDPDLPSLIRTVRGAGYMFAPGRISERPLLAADDYRSR
jgi:DNA-binding response OmpR family regulator